MRIINRSEFLALEGEVVFSKYAPQYFDNPEIKLCNSGTRDFCTQQLVDAIKCGGSSEQSDLLFMAVEDGAQLELDFDCGGRDGYFDDNQLFAVWEKHDVVQLIERLILTLDKYPPISK